MIDEQTNAKHHSDAVAAATVGTNFEHLGQSSAQSTDSWELPALYGNSGPQSSDTLELQSSDLLEQAAKKCERGLKSADYDVLHDEVSFLVMSIPREKLYVLLNVFVNQRVCALDWLIWRLGVCYLRYLAEERTADRKMGNKENHLDYPVSNMDPLDPASGYIAIPEGASKHLGIPRSLDLDDILYLYPQRAVMHVVWDVLLATQYHLLPWMRHMHSVFLTEKLLNESWKCYEGRIGKLRGCRRAALTSQWSKAMQACKAIPPPLRYHKRVWHINKMLRLPPLPHPPFSMYLSRSDEAKESEAGEE